MSSQALTAPLPGASPGLTPQQLQAAAIDAAGSNREAIARLVGVSGSTIKNWRAKPEYKAELDRIGQVNSDLILASLRVLREDLTEGARKAIEALIIQLEATDANDQPMQGVRQDAAKILLDHGVKLLKEGTSEKAGPTTPIVINVGSTPPKPPA